MTGKSARLPKVVSGPAPDDFDMGSGPHQPKTVTWIGDGPVRHLAYAEWKNHVRDCERCAADGGCPAEAVLWEAYRSV